MVLDLYCTNSRQRWALSRVIFCMMWRKLIAEKKLRKEKIVIGSLGGGAVGWPSSSTSGRLWPSRNSGTGSCSSGDGARSGSGSWSPLYREMGGGTASSSLPADSSSEFPGNSSGQSEWTRQKWKNLRILVMLS